MAALSFVIQPAGAARLNQVIGDPLWRIESVQPGASVGDCPVTRMDSQGNPRIVYYDATQKTLLYAGYDGSKWSSPVEVAPAERGHITCESGMALQANGQPAVTFATDDNRLFYAPATCTGGTCAFVPELVTITLVPGETGDTPRYPVMVFDDQGNPQILFRYHANDTYWLIYTAKTGQGGTWVTEEPKKADGVSNVLIGAPETPGMGEPISVTHDASGNLRIAYYCMKQYTWYLTRSAAGEWSAPTLLTQDVNHFGIDITLDTAGGPHIVSIVQPQGSVPRLILFSCNASDVSTCTQPANWTQNPLDTLPDSQATSEMSSPRVRFSSINYPRITYYYRDASGVAGLKYIYLEDAGTSTYKQAMIAHGVEVGRHAALAITPSDVTAVSYPSGGANGLIFASQVGLVNDLIYLPVLSH
jgi:hypothetical protein